MLVKKHVRGIYRKSAKGYYLHFFVLTFTIHLFGTVYLQRFVMNKIEHLNCK